MGGWRGRLAEGQGGGGGIIIGAVVQLSSFLCLFVCLFVWGRGKGEGEEHDYFSSFAISTEHPRLNVPTQGKMISRPTTCTCLLSSLFLSLPY